MNSILEFKVLYDRDSDVLYISTRDAPAARGIEDSHGIVWRYDGQGSLIGATVIDYHDHWHTKRSDLTEAIASKFEIPQGAAERVLEHAKDF
ncbi:MAG: DUF2283 domain-containing protein [Bradyrhizobiaceae bacterium]|jgi:uncharacterized protein YuzE|nr:MAG: DUF2283 domain-containing protein [Bradyrhizobiaceae bacterium]